MNALGKASLIRFIFAAAQGLVSSGGEAKFAKLPVNGYGVGHPAGNRRRKKKIHADHMPKAGRRRG